MDVSGYVAAFNGAVATGDFRAFLTRFTDDAVMRFENVPGAGVLEFAGRPAYTSAYGQQPPDDQLDVTGPVRQENGALVVPVRWRRAGGDAVIRLTARGERVSRLVVVFPP